MPERQNEIPGGSPKEFPMPHITRRDFVGGLLAVTEAKAALPAPIGTALPPAMPAFTDPDTGRRVKQFTSVAAGYNSTGWICAPGPWCNLPTGPRGNPAGASLA